MRQIILDTETTGIDPKEGHRLIEIGAVEMVNRRLTGRSYHQYVNPERLIDEEAMGVHGITDERVANEPVFADVADAFWEFIKGAQLIIHNAPFDVGFIDNEFRLINSARGTPLGPVADHCAILDTLKLARTKHPGQRNNLDALCKRYDIDNGHRVLHGALLDAEILGDVYLAMTGGQTALGLDTLDEGDGEEGGVVGVRRLRDDRPRLVTPGLSALELERHNAWCEEIRAKADCAFDHVTIAALGSLDSRGNPGGHA
ncbi:DNA polymerase III subunit epsilon [Cobetia crustatorum]|uniref:DNA polymerase III subunit epsilon n=1 Tax=Cobetia crustatorum TaxID=553385 RepID=UPI0004680271|nr:DNA polymerase III subunit epsilon [Cobetia crustatorum]